MKNIKNLNRKKPTASMTMAKKRENRNQSLLFFFGEGA